MSSERAEQGTSLQLADEQAKKERATVKVGGLLQLLGQADQAGECSQWMDLV